MDRQLHFYVPFQCLGAKYKSWLKRGRLFAELLNDIITAAEDDKISEKEFQAMKTFSGIQ